jgi:hypothetical protein
MKSTLRDDTLIMRHMSVVSTVAALLSTANFAEATPSEASLSPDGFEPTSTVFKGWHARSQVAATFSLSDNQAVVGQQEGTTMNLGYKLDAEMGYEGESHEWRNPLLLVQGMSRSPSLPQLVKSQDELRFESVYLFRVTPWFGPYLRAGLATPVLRGHDVRAAQTTYVIARADGSKDTRVATSLPLTDMFRPLVLRQSAGPYVRALRMTAVNLEARVGFGGRETMAAGQLAVNDDEATSTVEIKELEDQQQAGPDAGLTLWGKLASDVVTYRLGVEAMVPVLRNPETKSDKTAFELMNVDVLGSLSVKLASFAALDYQLKVTRQPQLLDDTQLSHLLTLTFGVSTEPPKKLKTVSK